MRVKTSTNSWWEISPISPANVLLRLSRERYLIFFYPIIETCIFCLSNFCCRLQEFADSLGIEFVETSAKNATNVEKAFMAMSAQIKAKMKTQPANEKGKGKTLTPGASVGGSKGGCC